MKKLEDRIYRLAVSLRDATFKVAITLDWKLNPRTQIATYKSSKGVYEYKILHAKKDSHFMPGTLLFKDHRKPKQPEILGFNLTEDQAKKEISRHKIMH